jgi:hypothetical protein
MRVNISKRQVIRLKNIILCEAKQDEVWEKFYWASGNHKKHNPFEKGYVTNVEVRECADLKKRKNQKVYLLKE